MPSLFTRIARRAGFVPAADAQSQAEQQALIAHRRGVQQASAQQRSLLAALTTHDVAAWTGDGRHINAATESGLATVRARSRDAAQNNPWARRFVGMVERNILGPHGMRYQSRLRGPAGLQAGVNDALEAGYRAWCKRGMCDVTGRYSMDSLDKLALRHVAVDGEAFIELREGAGSHGLQVKLHPPTAVPLHARSDLGGGRRIRQGIEIDADGRVLAYHMVRDDELAESVDGGFSGASRGLVRVPADRMLHLFVPEQAGQLRGIPWLSAGLKSAWQAQDFASSGLNKARESAKRGGFFTSRADDMPLQDASSLADGIVAAGEGAAAGTPYQSLHDGTWEQLPTGMQATPFENEYPNIEYGQFIKDCVRNMASAWGTSYFTLGNDLEAVNYSSGQLGMEDERAMWKTLQSWYRDEVKQALFERWLRMALLAAPELRSLSVQRTEAYIGAATWQCHRWQPIDPLKTVNAQRERIDLRLTSPQREIAAAGDDPDEILAELREWQQLTADLPAAPAADPSAAAARHLHLIQANA